MTQYAIKFSGEILSVGDRRFVMPHPVDDAFVAHSVVIVLLAPDSVSGKSGQFANLVAIDPTDGGLVWEAELPTTSTGDRYYKLGSRDPLVAYSVKSFVSTIDPDTGRIVQKEFVK